LLGDSIGGQVVGFSSFPGRSLQRDAETQTLSHQLHLMIPEHPVLTHTRSTAVTPFTDIMEEHDGHAQSQTYTPLLCLYS